MSTGIGLSFGSGACTIGDRDGQPLRNHSLPFYGDHPVRVEGLCGAHGDLLPRSLGKEGPTGYRLRATPMTRLTADGSSVVVWTR
jgi:hypothetical protein